MVDAHFKILNPTNHANNNTNIPTDNFLCVLIRLILMKARPTIPQINAVLDNVNTIAAIQSAMTILLRIAFLLAEKNDFIDVNFCLQNMMITGRNAMRKYP